jgi:hypothetical protein
MKALLLCSASSVLPVKINVQCPVTSCWAPRHVKGQNRERDGCKGFQHPLTSQTYTSSLPSSSVTQRCKSNPLTHNTPSPHTEPWPSPLSTSTLKSTRKLTRELVPAHQQPHHLDSSERVQASSTMAEPPSKDLPATPPTIDARA